MQIDTNAIMSMTEANQNFSRVARMVDENGAAVILKNNSRFDIQKQQAQIYGCRCRERYLYGSER